MQRNTLQIEKDMIHDFYQNTREEIKELEAEIKNFDTKMQREEETHNTLVVSHLQKVQHHQYEHGEAIENTKAEGAEIMRHEDEKHSTTESNNRQGKQNKKEDYERNDQANISEIEQETKQHQQNLDSLEHQLESNKKTLIQLYEQKQVALQKELELRMKVELHEIEERKNQHINDLMINHETAFREMKQYYNDITNENLQIIKQLQEKYQDVKLQIANSEIVVNELKESVLALQGPLATERAKKATLEKSVANYEVNAMGLRNAKGSLEDIQRRLKHIKEEKAKLDEKKRKAEQEKNDMYRKFEIAIKQLQSRAEYKNDILERKLAVFQRDLERKEMTLRELVQRSGLDQATVDNICKNMEEAIEAKNSILRNLKYSLAHAIKAYNDAIRVYEAKLLEFGIPADELGIEPLVTNTSTMPAGLVAA